MVTTAGSARWTELFLRLPSNNASQLSGPVFTVVNDDEMIEMTAQGGQASTFIRLAMVCIMLRHLTRSNRSSLDRLYSSSANFDRKGKKVVKFKCEHIGFFFRNTDSYTRHVAGPVLMLLLLTLSCLVFSKKRFFENDELYSYYLLSDPSFRHMWGAFNDAINNSPPLYFAVGRVWAALFGSDETSLRLFSSLAMSFALLILWRVLREPFGNWASILGLGLAFTAPLIVYQNANARSYGLFLACTALCVAAIARNDRQAVSNSSLFMNAAAFMLLVQSHLFGPIYAAALIAAQIIADIRRGRLRPSLYFAMTTGVATFALYLPVFFNQAENGDPRMWIPPTFLQDLPRFCAAVVPVGLRLLGIGDFGSTLWIILVIAGTLITVWWPSREEPVEIRRHQQHLSTVAWALLLVPLVVWLGSWAIKPIFFDRYVIPSVLGLAILYSAIGSRFLKPMLSSANRPVRLGTRAAAGTVAALIGWTPFVLAQRLPIEPTPGSEDNQYGYDALPIVVPFSHDYLRRRQYSPNSTRYYFLLDWTTAVDPASGDFAPQADKELSALKRQYPNRFTTVLEQSEFLSSHSRFLVLKFPETFKCHVPLSFARKWSNFYCWQVYDRRIAADHRFRTTRLGEIDRKYELMLVERNN